MLVMKLVSVLS